MTESRWRALEAASERARRLYDSPQFRGIYVSGAQAALNGEPSNTCPHKGVGWSKTRRIAWMRGHQSCSTVGEE